MLPRKFGGVVLIRVITTREHRYTHHALYRELALDLEVISYDRVLKRRSFGRGTYIFADLDRLPDWQLQEAALLHLRLRDAGMRVLNDPAKFARRFGLLRALNRAGINDFDAYRVDSLERPSRWPVFLRVEGDHASPVSSLLHDQAELDAAIDLALQQGAPRSTLLVVEFAAEPVQAGLYRKLSVFRVGETLLGYTCVHDDNWLVKYGKLGITPPELYDEEYSFVAGNPYADAVRPAFDLAGIEYGRVDFGLVGGRPQIYEINTNPHVSLCPTTPVSKRRGETLALFRTKYLEAMKCIDTAPRPPWRARAAFARHMAERLPGRAMRLARRAFA